MSEPRTCRGCGELFSWKHGRQIFCSPKCRKRQWWRAQRGKPAPLNPIEQLDAMREALRDLNALVDSLGHYQQVCIDKFDGKYCVGWADHYNSPYAGDEASGDTLEEAIVAAHKLRGIDSGKEEK